MLARRVCRNALTLTLSGILHAPVATADHFTRPDIITAPTPWRYSICHGHTCARLALLKLTASEWRIIRDGFTPPANPAQERGHIATAIAQLEALSAARIGGVDRARNRSGIAQPGQMDCIDESTNSSTYLRILADQGLLRWHRVEDRVTRGLFILRWPHTTAVISEIQSGKRYAVDSWFLDNGQAPFIVPLEVWMRGWEPGQ